VTAVLLIVLAAIVFWGGISLGPHSCQRHKASVSQFNDIEALRSEVEALDAREVLLVCLHRPTTSTVLHVPVADAKNSSPSANKPAISTDYPHRNWRRQSFNDIEAVKRSGQRPSCQDRSVPNHQHEKRNMPAVTNRDQAMFYRRRQGEKATDSHEIALNYRWR
jgi:hypothetical protein